MQRTSISLADFREITGTTISERVAGYYGWQSTRRSDGTWAYDKTLQSAPLPVSKVVDGCGRRFEGPNYCSQDYLSLASHEAIKEAAINAIQQLGVHSAGSSALLGNTAISRQLEDELADFVNYEHLLLFPTGWAAGYGVIKGLVRPDDWVIMDALSHACLQEGAKAATRNIVSVPHLDNEAFEKRLARIRASHPHSFILAITETVFSMDSDTPDFHRFLDICRSYGAVSLVDVAHDLGCLGFNGRGQLEIQNAIGGPDILIGSFSKTFASNGGFIATKAAATKEYLKNVLLPPDFLKCSVANPSRNRASGASYCAIRRWRPASRTAVQQQLVPAFAIGPEWIHLSRRAVRYCAGISGRGRAGAGAVAQSVKPGCCLEFCRVSGSRRQQVADQDAGSKRPHECAR